MGTERNLKAPRDGAEAARQAIRSRRREPPGPPGETSWGGASACAHHDDGEPAIQAGEPPREDRAG